MRLLPADRTFDYKRVSYVGKTFGHLVVLEDIRRPGEPVLERCKCTRCGQVVTLSRASLRGGQKSCSCGRTGAARKIVLEKGQRFGRLTVEAEVSAFFSDGRRRYLCLCDCGQHIVTELAKLTGGYAMSCGCLRREICRKLGEKRRKSCPAPVSAT